MIYKVHLVVSTELTAEELIKKLQSVTANQYLEMDVLSVTIGEEQETKKESIQ